MACIPQVLSHERLRAYRFYVIGEELAVFPAGIGSIIDGQFVPQTQVSRVIGGIGHGARMISNSQLQCDMNSIRENDQLAQLEGATDDAIMNLAYSTADALVIEGEHITESVIRSPSWWFSLLRGFSCQAILDLGYSNLQNLALPSLSDARRAVEGLKPLLDDKLTVSLSWKK